MNWQIVDNKVYASFSHWGMFEIGPTLGGLKNEKNF